ncbi:hypothetical protein FA15DRAFT_261471 [Coprinopsis marcescibilis]|uniref:Uncharacterized protein n=1 Tax=Coprinopsis marcescibilis TaxID=230819 RepID=A0A5C3KEA3_COPMA|nr:hypothetical protein FA15DRAFT_261471 [Coprinopsis marcescibilis]
MTKPDPRARVTMAEALKMLDNIIKKTGCYKLRSRSRLVPGRYAPQTKFLDTVKERVHHWRTTIAYIARGLPAVPADP